MAKLILGCGYLGRRVARLWLAAGETVFAVTRSSERAAQLAAEGLQPLIANPALDSQLPVPHGVKTVLVAIGFDRQAGRDIVADHVAALSHVIASLERPVHRFLYVSSTGVYGQVAGVTVDEDSACEPNRESGRACLAAERLLPRSAVRHAAVILRMAGLYGPGRIPRSADLLADRPIDAPASGWLNLIHVDDAARIVLLAEELAGPPRTYVVSDGQPVQRADYYAELARLLAASPPQFVESPSDSPAKERAASDKRINPQRMFAELKPRLVYPSFREGLAASLP